MGDRWDQVRSEGAGRCVDPRHPLPARTGRIHRD